MCSHLLGDNIWIPSLLPNELRKFNWHFASEHTVDGAVDGAGRAWMALRLRAYGGWTIHYPLLRCYRCAVRWLVFARLPPSLYTTTPLPLLQTRPRWRYSRSLVYVLPRQFLID